MDVRLRRLAARQRDIVAVWQLLAVGWTLEAIWHAVRRHGWRQVHSGVYALTQAPLTTEQRRMAATLTAPDSFLSHFSAAAHYGIWRFGGVRDDRPPGQPRAPPRRRCARALLADPRRQRGHIRRHPDHEPGPHSDRPRGQRGSRPPTERSEAAEARHPLLARSKPGE